MASLHPFSCLPSAVEMFRASQRLLLYAACDQHRHLERYSRCLYMWLLGHLRLPASRRTSCQHWLLPFHALIASAFSHEDALALDLRGPRKRLLEEKRRQKRLLFQPLVACSEIE